MRFGRLLLWITLFGIAMAFLESSVVVYIRALLYPEGFDFPLVMMDKSLAVTEIIREVATIIMLLGAGMIAGKNFSERFAWFIYCFAIWDIFYYVFLKLLIGWPVSLMTWDVLFLIPVTWTGPVLSPLIVCGYMLSLSIVILYFNNKGLIVKINAGEWISLIIGAVILIIAFAWDYSSFIFEHYTFRELVNFPDAGKLFDLAIGYTPQKFNWWLFITGSLPILGATTLIVRRYQNKLYQKAL